MGSTKPDRIEHNPHSLIVFCKTSNALIYDFEDDIKLTIMKSNDKIKL